MCLLLLKRELRTARHRLPRCSPHSHQRSSGPAPTWHHYKVWLCSPQKGAVPTLGGSPSSVGTVTIHTINILFLCGLQAQGTKLGHKKILLLQKNSCPEGRSLRRTWPVFSLQLARSHEHSSSNVPHEASPTGGQGSRTSTEEGTGTGDNLQALGGATKAFCRGVFCIVSPENICNWCTTDSAFCPANFKRHLTRTATSSWNLLGSCAPGLVKNCSAAGASPDLNAFMQC